ncbi:retrovirus-related pol polyprotein from transposon TNT 1-94 [Tanacetum coccineum]
MDDMIRMKNTKFATYDAEIDTLKQTLSKHVKENESLLTTLHGFKTELKQTESKSIDKEIVLENKNKELEHIVFYKNERSLKFIDAIDVRPIGGDSSKGLLQKLKGKNVIYTVVSNPHATTVAPGMYKLELEPLPPKVLKNMDAHIAFIKHSRDHADTLRDIVKSARELSPLDSNLDRHVVQIVLWYLDSGCSKHMTRNRSQLTNFVNKFLGTVKFGNDQIAKIMGYGDYQIRNVTISRVYYVEGLGHNLFSVGQFYDSDLKVAFHNHTCFVRNLEGVDLLSGSQGNNLYTLSIGNMMKSSPICLLSKASKTKSWLWHQCLSHLNFGTINQLAKQGLVRGLPKLKFEKDHLCSACLLGKSKKHSHKPKFEDTNHEKLYLMHMDLYGLMRVESINGKKYNLVIVDDYSRFTWVKFLRSKDEALEFIIKFLKMIQVRLNATVRHIRTNNGT